MQIKAQIEKKLQMAFSPHSLEVIDESHLHHGHAGWREGGNTHFRIKISGGKFEGTNRISQHREINKTLKDEFEAGIHALAIELTK